MHPITRFAKYATIGVSTFALDLALLFLFTDYFGIHYVLSAGLAFCIAISLNYFLARRFVFNGTIRSVHAGYTIFFIIAGIGLALVTSMMYFSVNILGFNYLASRIFIAGLVGFWTYLSNLYWNFKMAG